MSIGECCTRRVLSAEPGEMIRTVAKRMDQEDVGCVVVVDAEGRAIGMLTDRDITLRVLRRHMDPDQTAVRQVMSDDLTTLRESAAIAVGLARLRSDGLRRAPVVDDTGRVIGIFAVDDTLAHIARDLSAASQVVGAQRALATT